MHDHEALLAAGFAVLIFDYRGFGDSGGDTGVLSPGRQLQDLVNAVTSLTTRADVIADEIAASTDLVTGTTSDEALFSFGTSAASAEGFNAGRAARFEHVTCEQRAVVEERR